MKLNFLKPSGKLNFQQDRKNSKFYNLRKAQFCLKEKVFELKIVENGIKNIEIDAPISKKSDTLKKWEV